jgi:hypothetical protein
LHPDIVTAASLSTPALYPFAFDPAGQRVQFMPMDEAAYQAASFMDERLLDSAAPGGWVTWNEVRVASQGLAAECDFIFHIGHVGSTLLSRLLGQDPAIFSLREPSVLRTLAQTELDPAQADHIPEWAGVFLALWARTWRPGQRTLLKATSFTAELAPLLMRLNPSSRAILMLASPSAYLAGLLASDGTRQETRIAADLRLARLHRRLGRGVWRRDLLGEGELAAMSWLCEITSLADTARAAPERVMWLNFETLLAHPADRLTVCLQRLRPGAADIEALAEAMAGSPEMGRYSKAPEFAYDADLRRRVLAQSAQENAEEIARGIAWLNSAGAEHPKLANAMRLAGAAARGG